MPQWKTIPEIAKELDMTYQGVLWMCQKAKIPIQKQEKIIQKKMIVNVIDMLELKAYINKRP